MKNESMTSKAYDYLYNAIAEGKYPPGSALSEAELSEKLHISRSPIRETLRRMESEGLVKHYPNRGTLVVEFTREDMEEIFQLRMLMELYALKITITKDYDAVLDAIEKEFEESSRDNDKVRFYEADAKLHSMIISYSGNSRLQRYMDMLDAQIRIVKTVSRKINALSSKSYEVHRGIIEGLRKHDLELTEARLREHIDEVRKRTIESYKSVQFMNTMDSEKK